MKDALETSSRNPLEWLFSQEFDSSVPPLSSPSAIRAHLRVDSSVRTIAESLRNGLIGECQVRHSVAKALRDFRPGHRFAYETALCALAVALEGQFSNFADEYLRDLAAIRASEIPIAIRVAREALHARSRMTTTSRRMFEVTSGSTDTTWAGETIPIRGNGHQNGWKLVEVQCA